MVCFFSFRFSQCCQWSHSSQHPPWLRRRRPLKWTWDRRHQRVCQSAQDIAWLSTNGWWKHVCLVATPNCGVVTRRYRSKTTAWSHATWCLKITPTIKCRIWFTNGCKRLQMNLWYVLKIELPYTCEST